MPRLPIAILLLALATGAGLWLYLHQRPEVTGAGNQTQTHSRVPAAEEAPRPSGSRLTASPESKKPERKTDADQQPFLEELEDKVVVNLGTIEDIGKHAATMLVSRKELLELKAMDLGDRTQEQGRRLLELERQSAVALGMLPEITSFQDNPEDYARFFRSLLQEAAGLEEAQANEVSDFMRGRGEAMVATKLNAANEPEDPELEEAWEERRDEFNEETARGVAQLLPTGEAERIGFTAGFLELLEQDFDKAD